MRQPLVAAVVCSTGLLLAVSSGSSTDSGTSAQSRSIVISNGGGELARVPLSGESFAVSYRNSIYGTYAEERYAAQPDGSYRLVQIAADQLAVLEEYYAVPSEPSPADPNDRRKWTVDPDPARPAEFTSLSLAATDLGQRTLHVPGATPVELWKLADNDNPFVVLNLKENQ